MKNLLKKLHMKANQSEDSEGSTSSKGRKSNEDLWPDGFSPSQLQQNTEQKSVSELSNWLNSAASRHSPSPSSSLNVIGGERTEPSDLSSSGLDVIFQAAALDSPSGNSRYPDIEEEYQIQLALEMSVREDPEAVQIEAVKQISLGSCAPENSPAEVVAYRYWNYNVLGYDDKILDGFYDLYGFLTESISERMPSLVDLQGTPVSESVTWEAILVNRAADANLLKLEEEALMMVVKSGSESSSYACTNSARMLAVLVADYMGGPVVDPENMSRAWQRLTHSLKETLGSMVLPLGSLTIGLARHRALLFKVLADSTGIPCRLLRGQQYTGSSDVAMNYVKLDDGREYIVDLMADPGTLIPSDAVGSQYEESFYSSSPRSREMDSSHIASCSSWVGSSSGEHSEFGTSDKRTRLRNFVDAGNETNDRGEVTAPAISIRPINVGEESKISSDEFKHPSTVEKGQECELPSRPSYPYMHARSPSWTEGISSPGVHRLKVKDVSKYMIDAAKENPQLAQKLHDVLFESGVVAPPNLFLEIYHEKLDKGDDKPAMLDQKIEGQNDLGMSALPPLPHHRVQSKAISPSNQLEPLKLVEGLGVNHSLELREVIGLPVSSQSEAFHIKPTKNVPVAAAAAAAAVFASSMVVAAAKTSTDSNLEVPVAAAATATAAALVATTAAVSKQYEHSSRSEGEADGAARGPEGSGDREREGSRISDRSQDSNSEKSDVALDDVAELEIPWEEITLGERIGLGSYGEVYRGDWHGTEIAVKRFLDQDISGESLEEFRSEVRIMKRVRHPNVVLFMGAVTRAPNLSIVTEFLPRGSLYRLLHRPNNHLDERRRLRMALDAARGMNYLHNCTPVIVHRDLKSPNLLVDKNWVVKVCDFGLSRLKNSTYLSSRSTAGTAEWMAPEVLRNEPSDEKCDIYSFGVILWELSTLQQPWGGMNPMQVVGAVGFQSRRLDIPDDMDPVIADIIRRCWQTNPKLRPTFAEIMTALKPLQKPITSSRMPRPSSSTSIGRDKRQSSSSSSRISADGNDRT